MVRIKIVSEFNENCVTATKRVKLIQYLSPYSLLFMRKARGNGDFIFRWKLIIDHD